MDSDNPQWQSGRQMILPANWTAVWLTAMFLGICFDAAGELASTQLDGLRIHAASIYRSGDTRDLDCSIGLKFTGGKADRAISMSPVKIIEAVDDTGLNLVRTKQRAAAGQPWPPTKSDSGFWQMVGGLKAPVSGAKTIRHLEAEVDLFAPTASTPVLTNFMSRPGVVLHQATLDQYQIHIRYDRETNNPPPPGSLIIDNSVAGKAKGKTVLLKVDDPRRKLVSVAFQKADGGILPATRQSQIINGTHTDFSYAFQEAPPHDLNLVVYVASPEASETVRFCLDDIRLPWVDLPTFEASAEVRPGSKKHGTNAYACSLTLSFTGGPLTNALGIRNLWINEAEDDLGQPVHLRWTNCWFTAMPPALGDGRYVRKSMGLVFQSHEPRAIRVLKGEAELIHPNTANDHIVCVKNFMSQTGELFDLPRLRSNRVKLTYLGPVNYAAKRSEFVKTNWVTEQQGGTTASEVLSDTPDSLMLSLNDPDKAVIAPWGSRDVTFLDAQDRTMEPTRVMTSGELHGAGEFRVYRFKTLPPWETRLRLYLAVPGSIQRVPFEIENIPVPPPALK